ncbi:MAG: hypothetical protein ISR58_05595 [Anaerolineales bacterium]|nr:hypothetical protein [Chloroflexota bacterium]MBL6980649.1 hypothetical protein [Anaerolineales bacterium]
MKRMILFVILGLTVVILVSLVVLVQPTQAEVCGPNDLNDFEDLRRMRFVSLKGKTGQAGIGWVTFVTKNIMPDRAILTINGLGDFSVMGISCTCGAQKTCTGFISGYPIGDPVKHYAGKLTVYYQTTYRGHDYEYKKFTSTAPKLQIPPAP